MQNASVFPNASFRYCSLLSLTREFDEAQCGTVDTAAGNTTYQGYGTLRDNWMRASGYYSYVLHQRAPTGI